LRQIVRAAGGVVIKDSSKPAADVLLIKRNGVWDLPKGKTESGENIDECALREVEEETGVEKLSILSFLCQTYHEYEEAGQKIGKYTDWYSMKSGDKVHKMSPQIDEGITEVTWVELGEAINLVHFENLKTVLKTLKEKLPEIKKA
jgi:8-oxo-dGTP pyrophosphatase MutT (NUDIX family)